MDCKYPHCMECEYADCMYDRLEAADFENDMWEENQEKNLKKERDKRYSESHKEKISARSKKWYEDNRERANENSRKWNRENRQRIAAKKRERWAQNPALYRQKQQEYKAGLNANLPHCNECENCVLVEKEKGSGYRRLCIEKMRLIEQKVSNSPHWCEKRKR